MKNIKIIVDDVLVGESCIVPRGKQPPYESGRTLPNGLAWDAWVHCGPGKTVHVYTLMSRVLQENASPVDARSSGDDVVAVDALLRSVFDDVAVDFPHHANIHNTRSAERSAVAGIMHVGFDEMDELVAAQPAEAHPPQDAADPR